MTKETVFALKADLTVSKVGKSPKSYPSSEVRVCRVVKEDAVSFKVEGDSSDGVKNVLSRSFSEKSSFESSKPNSLEWTDRRGTYTFSSDDTEAIKTLRNAIATCLGGGQDASINDKAWAKLQTQKVDRSRGGTFMGGQRGPTSPHKVSPTAVKPTETDPLKKRGSFLKRRSSSQMLKGSGDETPSPRSSKKNKPTPPKRRASTRSDKPFFDQQLIRMESQAGKSSAPEKKTINVQSRYETSIYVTQILIGDPEFFKDGYDKKLIPQQIGRCLKHLTGSLDKKWVLCSVIEWDELQKLEELREQGLKKATNPYVTAEYLISLLRDYSPVAVFDNFEPAESFLEISGTESKENDYLCKLIGSQPEFNKALLGSLITFLQSAVAQKATNKMSASHLAKLFGPFIVAPKDLAYKKTFPTKLENPLVL